MNKKVLCISALAISMLFLNAPMVNACHNKYLSSEVKEHVAKELGLSMEQKMKLKMIKNEARAMVQPKREHIKLIRMKINQMYQMGNPNMFKIDQLIYQEKNDIGDILKIRAMERSKFYSILTPEQRMKLNQMIEKCYKKHMHKKHHHKMKMHAKKMQAENMNDQKMDSQQTAQ